MTPVPNGPFVSFARKVGVVASASIAVGVILAWAASFAWRNATRPIVDKIAENTRLIMEERRARASVDSMMVAELKELNRDVYWVSEAMGHPLFSDKRETALDKVAPPRPPIKRRRVTP